MPHIVPISELRQDASSIVKQAAASGAPVFITQHGRASAVLMSAGAYERTQRELEILRTLARGEADIQAGFDHDIDAVLAHGNRIETERELRGMLRGLDTTVGRDREDRV